MTYGPFTESQADRIEELLRPRAIVYTRTHSEADVEAWRDGFLERSSTPNAHPRFDSEVAAAYFEISDDDVKKLGPDLDEYGIIYSDGGESELEGPEEYLCLKCDFSADQPQLCPKHRIPLVTFSEKAEALRNSSDSKAKYIFVFLFLAVVAIFGYIIFKDRL